MLIPLGVSFYSVHFWWVPTYHTFWKQEYLKKNTSTYSKFQHIYSFLSENEANWKSFYFSARLLNYKLISLNDETFFPPPILYSIFDVFFFSFFAGFRLWYATVPINYRKCFGETRASTIPAQRDCLSRRFRSHTMLIERYRSEQWIQLDEK